MVLIALAQLACALKTSSSVMVLVSVSKALKVSADVVDAAGASTSSKPPAGTARTTVFVGTILPEDMATSGASAAFLPRPSIMLGELADTACWRKTAARGSKARAEAARKSILARAQLHLARAKLGESAAASFRENVRAKTPAA